MIYISPGKERCETLALFMIENNATVRSTASHFGISKSTVHKDLSKTLRYTNKNLFIQVNEILKTNKSERHIRGGEATKRKYEKKRKLIIE
jgi:putative DeoR family transcriptional regulator (stage III sporulation protein D)